jgi:transposase, IS30 family
MSKKAKKREFAHLNQFARDRLEAMLRDGMKQKDIAEVLKVDKSTVSREVAKRRRKDGRYDASLAEHKASILRSNSKYQGMKIEQNPELKKRIITELKALRSPDEIAGRMRKEELVMRANKDAIYKWIYSAYGAQYCKYLCTRRYKKKAQKNKTERVMIPNRVNVEWRPDLPNLIHAEGDTFVSPKKAKTTHSVAFVVVEKLFAMRKMESLKPVEMGAAVKDIEREVRFDTLTLDNGIENRLHESFGVLSFFCDPHSPWQKPRAEGGIGLVRRWFLPKGTDLSEVSQQDLDLYANILNGKYRKSLGYRSASEAAKESGILKSLSGGVALH